MDDSALAPTLAAPQHRPRPLPLFLDLLRSETAANPERMARALAGLRAYQEAPRPPSPPLMPVIAEAEGAMLRDYGGDGSPVLFLPSLINPPSILDLAENNSLLRWLARRGNRVLLLDWGTDLGKRGALDIAAHVERIVLPVAGTLDSPPALVGYCLGGTIALAAAARMQVAGLATIAAPWHFAGFPDDARATLAELWSGNENMVRALDLLPMEVLQSAFWSLDPARTVAKFEAFASLDPASDKARAFVTLEDWANDGPPIGEAAAEEMFLSFFRDDVPGRGEWIVGGAPVDPSALDSPILNIVSTTDRIVPAASAIRVGERIDLALGHVGMVVGGRAKASLWEPLEAWLSRIGRE